MGSDHLKLLYYTKVCWLSKGNVLARVFELREELEEVLNDTSWDQTKDNAFMPGYSILLIFSTS